MSTLSDLIGSQLEFYEIEVGNSGFQFSIGYLAVFNPIEIIGELNSLVGSEVVSVNISLEESMEIELNNGSRLIVSLMHNHYIGPEAFCFHFKNGLIVVE